jgi:hypothetical protein
VWFPLFVSPVVVCWVILAASAFADFSGDYGKP